MATKRTGTRLKREKKKSKVSRSVESAMFWAKVFATKYDLVLAVCDEELLERELKMRHDSKGEGKTLKVKISKNFYGGMLVNESIVTRLMQKATIGNLMGSRAVELAAKSGFIVRENIILIDEVPHAQFVKISEIR